MGTTKLNIGKIPISKGEYQEGTTYQRLNQVTMLGSTYQSKIDDNTSAPAQMGADGAVENINTDKWLCVAVGNVSAAKKVVYNNETSGLEAENVQGAIDEIASKKFNKENIAQEFGESKDKVVSQFAIPFRKKESLEFLYLIVDSNDRFLFGIRMDGTVDWAKGVPFPVLQKIKEIFKEQNDNNGELVQKLNNAITELNDQKVDKEVGKSLISEGIAEAFSIDDNEEFLYVIKDLADNLLWGIKKDGSTYDPNGIPEKVKKLIEEINKRINKQETRLHLVDNSDYVFAIADEMNNLLFAIDKRGASFVNALKGVMVIEKGEDENFIFAVKDSADNLLFGIRHDGTFVCSKFELPVPIIKQLEETINSKYLHTEDEDMEYIFRLQDVKGAVLFGVKWDGTNYIPKGIPLEQIAENKKIEKQITSLEEKLANFRGGTGDWSNAGKVQIPIPRCAMFNLLTSTMPTAKSGMGISGVTCDIPCYAEFWDMQGNYFKIPILLSAQGNSSMGFIKKNLAIDLFSDETRKDSFIAKFGDWVSQDSFHLKAYYTDTFRGVGAVSYMLYEEMVKTRDICDDRPYKSEFTGEYTESEDGINSETSLDRNFDTGAKCFPQAFPVIVYQNGEFYGVYSWQLKKHRDNMHQDKKVAEHIHLDGTLDEGTIFGGNIKWEQFEVRNPKSLYMQKRQVIGGEETLTYNGDYPKEIMGDDAGEYNAGNKDMKRCATVKKYIIALSGRIAELKQAETDGKSTDEIRTLVEKYFKVSFLVDYILETNLMYDYDGYAKNWQWTTYNGVQWTVNPYDHDCIFGDNHNGNYVSAPEENWIANTLDIPSGWILKYYLPELKARWAQLRKMSIFDSKHIADILNDWCVRIGYDNWKSEYKKWNESPCYRPSLINSTYWERCTSYVDNWSKTTIYRKGFVVDRNGKAYKSLIEDNIGNDPLLDDGTKWEDVTYSTDRQYSVNDICYYGKSILYGFKCKADCTGEAPLAGFYNLYPMELGHYDSVYRVEKWLKKRIGYMDKLLDYSEV